MSGSLGGASWLSRVIAPPPREHGLTVIQYPAIAGEPRGLVVIYPAFPSWGGW